MQSRYPAFAVVVAGLLIGGSLLAAFASDSWHGLLTGVVGVAVLLHLLFGLLRSRRLPADAEVGVGTVVDVARTGLEVNDVPRYRLTMDVIGAGGREFSGRLHMFIPHHEVGVVRPGTVLPVAYDPARPDRLHDVPAERLAEAQDVYHRHRVLQGLEDPRVGEIWARGVRTTGVVMSLVPTGEIRHGHTALELRVRFPGGTGIMVERAKQVFLRPAAIGQLGTGQQVEVRYLPEDDTQFSLNALSPHP